jgi:hypothetical protein
VFRDWIITNDTFVGMDYVMGESCGDINRETKVSGLVRGLKKQYV